MGSRNKILVLSLFLVFMAVFGFGGTAEALLSAVSPNIDPVNGFPVWYQDTTGIKLALCLDGDPLCLADPVDPTNPASVAMGLGEETFYWMADARIDMPNLSIPNPPDVPKIGGRVQLIMAVEAAFAGTPLRDGGQLVFARHRIILDAPIAGIYTVTHPYGVEQFNVTEPGVHVVRAADRAPHVAGNLRLLGDIGCETAPCDFSLANNGLIGPFLMWDPAVLPAAPAGYLGDPAVEHKIVGSPIGQNLFRVEGPPGSNLGGPGVDFVETDLFMVQGKILQAQPPVATFTRDASGVGSVDVMVSDVTGGVPTVDVLGIAAGAALNPVVGQPGVFSVSIAIGVGDVMPATVDVTVDQGAGAAIQTVPLTDIVAITTATFDPVNGDTVTVTATSSNLFDNTVGGAPLPVLTVKNPAIPAPADVLGTIDTFSTTTLVLPAVAPQPGRVVVTSNNGGLATLSVTDLRPGGLAAVSPNLDPVNGFPEWYQDHNGLQLGQCLNPALCLPDPIDPLNPDSLALGIGGEAFYWLAEADLRFATGDNALLVLALEQAFLTGPPVIGDQIVFGRVRIRIDAPVAGTYSVVHPFGIEQFNVITPGDRAINSEVGAPHVAGNVGLIGDIGCFTTPCDVTLPLKGLVGPFLTWDPAFPPAAPAGYVGDPNIPHQVTGSPIGANIFRVVGPLGSNIGGPGIDFLETNLFTVQGKIFGQAPPTAPGVTFTQNPLGAGTINPVVPAPPLTTVVDVVGVDAPLPGQPVVGGVPLTPVPGQTDVFQGSIALGPNDTLPREVTITIDRGLPTQTTRTVRLRDVVSVVTATFEPRKGRLKVKAVSSNKFDNRGGGRPAPVLTVANPDLIPLVANLRDGSIELAVAGAIGTIDTAATDTLDVAGITPAPTNLQVGSTDGGLTAIPVTNVADPNAPVDPGAPVIPGNLPTLAELAGSSGGGGCFIDGLME